MIVSRERAEMKTPENVYRHIKKIFCKQDAIEKDKEHFYLLILNSKNKVKCVDLITVGILNASLVHPREVFRRAIKEGASTIILAHNHPSGNSEPSEEDKDITKRLIEAGKIIGIELVDHVIIGDKYLSFRESNLI